VEESAELPVRWTPPMLTIVGTGYNVSGQITPEAREAMERADRLFYLVNDPVTAGFLTELNNRAESLVPFYRQGEPARRAFTNMAERIVAPLGDGLEVAAAFVGNPAVLNPIAHETRRLALSRGAPVRMLPGISIEDCLIADVGWSPEAGRALRTATDFLVRRRLFDSATALILTGVGTVGETIYRGDRAANRPGLRLLTDALQAHYPPDHEVVLYEPSLLPLEGSPIDRLPLRALPEAEASVASILLVPPRRRDPVDYATAR